MDEKLHVSIIEPLRGFAAISVCWFHLTNGQEGWLRSSGSLGWLGVECFFVISGFVIPLSMYRAKFKLLSDWKTFFGKRFLRLEPPYLFSIFLTIGLWYLSSLVPSFAGQAPNISFIQLITHLGYINAFLGYDWINPVYWTLAIEFQYYVIISIFYFLIASPSIVTSQISILVLATLSFFQVGSGLVLSYMVVFAFGIATFKYHVRHISQKLFGVQLFILSAISISTLGFEITIICILTSLSIAFVRINTPQFMSLLGTISYSIYLIHVPIGGRIVSLGKRFANTLPTQIANTLPTQIIVLLCALAVTIVLSYITYIYIERPSKILSSSLRYMSKK